MRSSPEAITGLEDDFTDWAVDTQIDRTLFKTDVLSLRGSFTRENSNLAAMAAQGTASPGSHHLNTVNANVEYHFGNRASGTFGWFDTHGTVDPFLYAPGDVSGSANGDPRGSGYIANVSFWPCSRCFIAGPTGRRVNSTG